MTPPGFRSNSYDVSWDELPQALKGDCGSVMHGIPYGKTLRYVCDTYVNSGGANCEHNWVEQEQLLPSVLQVIQENALPSMDELRKTLRELLAETQRRQPRESNLATLKREVEMQAKVVQKALEAVSAAQDDEEREGLRKIYRRERAKMEGLDAQMKEIQAVHVKEPSEDLVNAAIAELKDLRTKLENTSDRRELSALFHAINRGSF